jgi:hypothetical protein
VFENFRKNLKMAKEGLLTPNEANVEAAKFILSALELDKSRVPGDSRYFIATMRKDIDFYSIWLKEYSPFLDKAVLHSTLPEQHAGLRALALDCADIMASVTAALFANEDPWVERQEEEAAVLARFGVPNLSAKEAVDNVRLNWAVYEASLSATKFLLMKPFKDEPENYADAYELATNHAERLAAEKVLCQARGVEFSRDSELDRAVSKKHVIRGVLTDGRDLTVKQAREMHWLP